MEKIKTTFGKLTVNQSKAVYGRIRATGMIGSADIWSDCVVEVEEQEGSQYFKIFTIHLAKDVTVIVRE